MKIAKWSFGLWMLAAAGCAASVTPHNGGSESHFLLTCVDDSDCGSQLACTENVCTTECESTAQCAGLSAMATCEALGELQVCDFVCEDDRDCGGLDSGLQCSSGRCRQASEPDLPDGSVIDASEPEITADLLGTSEALGEPVELAFVAGTEHEQQVWLRGMDGALLQISTWPTELDQEIPCDRFAALSFDATGEYLAFVETLACFERSRVVVHDVSTGKTWSLGAYVAFQVDVSAGPRSMLASVMEGNIFEVSAKLFAIDLQAMKLALIETPTGNMVNGSHQQVVGVGAETEVVITNGQPVMRLSEDGAELFEPIDDLGANWQLSDLRASPSGEHVCINARDMMSPPGMDVARAVLATANGGSTQVIPEFDFSCVFSGDGGYVMFGGSPFEIVDDDLVPLPLPSEPLRAGGSFGEIFYATNEQSEVVRFDPATGAIEVVIELGMLEGLCSSTITPPRAELFLPEDGRGVGLVHVSCGDDAAYEAASLALDLATGAYVTIETGSEVRFGMHDIAWPRDGRVLLFSALEAGDGASFYEVSSGPEVTVRTLEEIDGNLRTPAVPR
jgi:hypothetical protein